MQKQRKTKYQITETEQRLQKLNKYLLKIIRLLQNRTNLQKLNINTKLQKLKGRRNTKIIAETDKIPNFAEAEDKISLQKIFGALPQTPTGARCPLQTPSQLTAELDPRTCTWD